MNLGSLTLDPPVALAPMAGLSHPPFRKAAAEVGGYGLFFSEMLSAKALIQPGPRNEYLIDRHFAPGLLFYQLFAADPADIGPALDRLLPFEPDGIDLNLACPAPQIRKRGAGGSLGEDPDRAATVIRETRRRVSLPLTCKIRLPKDGSLDRLGKMLALLDGEGVDGVTIHPRLSREGLGRPPRWNLVGKVRKRFPRFMFINGGIFDVDDARRAVSESEADGVMLARGAIRNPHLGAAIGNPAGRPGADSFSRKEFLLFLIRELTAFFPADPALRALRFHLYHAAPGIRFGHHLWRQVQGARNLEEAADRVSGFFEAGGVFPDSPD